MSGSTAMKENDTEQNPEQLTFVDIDMLEILNKKHFRLKFFIIVTSLVQKCLYSWWKLLRIGNCNRRGKVSLPLFLNLYSTISSKRCFLDGFFSNS